MSNSIPFPKGKPCNRLEKLEAKDVFFCENGTSYKQAVKNGAAAIVTDKKISAPIPVLVVENVKKAFAAAWSEYTNHPEKNLIFIGVTGTNGKTSVASFLHTLLQATGEKAGCIGTVFYDDGKTTEEAPYTTPPPDILYPLLRSMVQNGVRYVVMEASSQGLSQYRLFGIPFAVGIFTNLTRDHLDYHKTMEAYKKAKASLFQNAEKSLLCMDDEAAPYMAWEAKNEVYYYGTSPLADFQIENLKGTKDGYTWILHTQEEDISLSFSHPGKFQVENITAAVSACLLLHKRSESLKTVLPLLHPPKGRMEKVETHTPYTVYIDYAHTPDALMAALTSLRPLTARLTVLFGAGGKRDRGKRKEMGKIADTYADRIILTNDNARDEDPLLILEQIAGGIETKKPIQIPDREKAICYALATAEKGEILLLAGKGHEIYMVNENGKQPFSETETIKKYLERKGKENVSELT